MKPWIAALLLSAAMSGCGPAGPIGYKLPEGKLRIVGASGTTATFLSIEQTKIRSDRTELWLYTVFEPAALMEGKSVAQSVNRRTLDCKNRTFKDMGVVTYDLNDKVLINIIPPDFYAVPSEPIRPNNSMKLVADIICDQRPVTGVPIIQGHTQALRFGQEFLKRKQLAK